MILRYGPAPEPGYSVALRQSTKPAAAHEAAIRLLTSDGWQKRTFVHQCDTQRRKFDRNGCSKSVQGISFCTNLVQRGAGTLTDGCMAGKVRFSVSIDSKINAAVEQVARRHKPELSKNYIVEFALVRLLEAIDGKQLALPLVLDPVADASR